jgi:hypothetical protein
MPMIKPARIECPYTVNALVRSFGLNREVLGSLF